MTQSHLQSLIVNDFTSKLCSVYCDFFKESQFFNKYKIISEYQKNTIGSYERNIFEDELKSTLISLNRNDRYISKSELDNLTDYSILKKEEKKSSSFIIEDDLYLSDVSKFIYIDNLKLKKKLKLEFVKILLLSVLHIQKTHSNLVILKVNDFCKYSDISTDYCKKVFRNYKEVIKHLHFSFVENIRRKDFIFAEAVTSFRKDKNYLRIQYADDFVRLVLERGKKVYFNTDILKLSERKHLREFYIYFCFVFGKNSCVEDLQKHCYSHYTKYLNNRKKLEYYIKQLEYDTISDSLIYLIQNHFLEFDFNNYLFQKYLSKNEITKEIIEQNFNRFVKVLIEENIYYYRERKQFLLEHSDLFDNLNKMNCFYFDVTGLESKYLTLFEYEFYKLNYLFSLKMLSMIKLKIM